MKHFSTFLLFSLVYCALAQNPLSIPPVLTGTNFDLNLQTGSVQFFPGQATQTLGINGDILGPTLMVNKGETVVFNVTNNIGEPTTIHWHGMHVSSHNDGGPHTVIMPGQTWSPVIPVLDWASTYWYHPHLHHKTHEHVTKGMAGFIIVKDNIEQALTLPKTYGVDDFPLVVQTKAFDANNQILADSELDSALFVNGTYKPFLDAPAQMVRLRLLNGSSMRYYNFGFSNNMTFYQIGSDGGLLAAPVAHTRLMVAPGERAEILINLADYQGQIIHLMNYGAQLPNAIYGATQPGMGAGQIILGYNLNPLNGANFNVLQINVVGPTANPVTTMPTTLVNHTPWQETQSNITRQLVFTSTVTGQSAINGPFVIDGAPFDMDVINYEIPLDNIEIWELRNQTPIGHPFHIHHIQFYVLTINGVAPPSHLAGRKDVIHVPGGNTIVRFIAKFETYADDEMPYMYHCHMLMHEDGGMMGQFLVKSPCTIQIAAQPQTTVAEVGENVTFSVQATSPNPLNYQWQTDLGFGWQNLSNAGQYSGVNTPMLTVSNTTLSNNNQFFRCQISEDNNCAVTSEAAVLEVRTSGLEEDALAGFVVFPNPFNTEFVLVQNNGSLQEIRITDLSGRLHGVYTDTGVSTTIKTTDWSPGVYFVHVGNAVQRLVRN